MIFATVDIIHLLFYLVIYWIKTGRAQSLKIRMLKTVSQQGRGEHGD
jgi:hypothetical protein